MNPKKPARSVLRLQVMFIAIYRAGVEGLIRQIGHFFQRLLPLSQRICILLLLVAAPLHAQSSADFRVQVLEDPTQKMQAADVLQALDAGRFRELPDQHFSAGYSDSVFWLWWEPRLPAT